MLTVGLTNGLASADVKPAGIEVQLYVYVPEPPLAPAVRFTLVPAHTVPGVAVGAEFNGPPLKVIVTASLLEQDVAVEVVVRVKIVVEDKLTVVGSSIAAFTSCEDGVQLYVKGPVPVTVAFNTVLVPYGMVASVPAFTTGNEFTVTAVAADTALRQPLALVTLTV